MYTFESRNVNHVVPVALALLRDKGIRIAPRGMSTLELDGVVATVYKNPREMVLFDPIRDANPFFHFFEALWILQGREDVGFLSYFLPRMADFSDDGNTFHAPYGYRLRHGFGTDQIEDVVTALKNDPDSRQAVMSIWNPNLDWQRTKDKPCNDMVMLKIRDSKLRMTVCNRSNDAVLGAYGANVVQFSTLLVYLAGRIGVEVGEYTQISDSFHVYEDNPFWQQWTKFHSAGVPTPYDPYSENDLSSEYMSGDATLYGYFDIDLSLFFNYWDAGYAHLVEGGGISGVLMNERNYSTSSFADVVLPMLQTVYNWKQGQRTIALETAKQIKAKDWRMAVTAWMERRIKNVAK